jgi:hypothetical protein
LIFTQTLIGSSKSQEDVQTKIENAAPIPVAA